MRRPNADASARRLLKDFGVAETPEAVRVARHVLTEPMAMKAIGARAAALLREDESDLPDVDALVEECAIELFAENLSALADALDVAIPVDALMRKDVRMGRETRRLLAFLLKRVGIPVPLAQLLLVNEMNNGTPRRLRELETELGSFSVEVRGKGLDTTYTLLNSEPDIHRCARYWLLRNLRNSGWTTDLRLLGLLAANTPTPVPLDDLLHVNPRRREASRGRGLTRKAQTATARRVRALREQGWLVYSGQDKVVAGLRSDEYVMLSLDRMPPYERLSAGVWKAVFKASGGLCTSCGWAPKQGASQGRKLLEVHHGRPQQARPEDVNDPSNLLVLCNVCHDGQHARSQR